MSYSQWQSQLQLQLQLQLQWCYLFSSSSGVICSCCILFGNIISAYHCSSRVVPTLMLLTTTE
jgi:hypothetical protein